MLRRAWHVERLDVVVLILTLIPTAGVSVAADLAVPPEITKLKALHLETDVVKDGQPAATIVVPASGCYDNLAAQIVAAVKESTGAALPIVKDDSPDAKLPLRDNRIALGNRSTNRLIGKLYEFYYTLLDLKYPGRGGHVVRTLHNPFADGFNVVLAGGSDAAGVEQSAGVLIEELKEAAREKSIRLDRIMEIRLGQGLEVPKDIRDVKTWEASAGYRSVGYFGWNSLSKRMALYYMTGDPLHARQFIRLAFPDAKARQEICDIDGERIEDKDHPLSGPYHYNAHMMILFWDLIEESPVFSEEERLRVTRAFAEQLRHWARTARATKPRKAVGSRHGQWDANSLYCLARYFQNYYPDPIWASGMKAGKMHFRSLHEYAWVSGEIDNLFWYNTGTAPILTYMLLTGDRVPRENGVLATLLRGQEILVSGRVPDWALNSASLGFLHKAAYLTGDGRWLAYRNRTGMDTGVFRVGQSYWPDESLKPTPPDDLVGKWTIDRLPKPRWEARRSGLPLEESFNFGSFRSRADAGGDFVLIDGFNGASRNPYHTFAILELRLAGYTLLKGYLNQVVTRVDGLMEPKIAMNAALKHCDVVGSTAIAVAEVPDAPFANWRRTLVQRTGRYALIIDELTFRSDGSNSEILFEWQTERGAKRLADGELTLTATTEHGGRRTDKGGQICMSDPVETVGGGKRWTMKWLGPVRQEERKTFFSLVGIQPGTDKPTMESHRIDDHAAALALPEPATAVVHAEGDTKAELVVRAGDHLFARAATRIAPLLEANRPVDVDWDLEKGTLHVVTTGSTTVMLTLDPSASPTLDDKPLAKAKAGAALRVQLAAGRHVVRAAVPQSKAVATMREDLKTELEKGRTARAEAIAARSKTSEPDVPALEPTCTAKFDAPIVDIDVVPTDAGPTLAVAEGKTIHVLGLDGNEQRTIATDGPIRMLCRWPEHRLLLAGCADEKVIAFDPSGKRKWVFVSEMDPAVFRAAKTYWFKSAPGHEGIHGLHVDEFIDGKSQAFVGSACTLEILDEQGKLIRRMPLFWGKNSTFAVIDCPDGSKNLLAARKYNGTNTVAIINNKTLTPGRRGFISVPSGHTYMPGWSSMNRHHLFYEDLDGDGTREVISEINGTWNRVCVWSASGAPLYSANFGPGRRIPAKTMRDIDVADLDGDGKKEIVAITSYRMVLALDSKCEKLWAKRLPVAATVAACIRPKGEKQARVVLGCNDGRLRVLDPKGQLVRVGEVAGQAAKIEPFVDADGNSLVAVGTNKGEVSVFLITP